MTTIRTYRNSQSFLERFWNKVKKSSGCWIWTAGRYTTPAGKKSYGCFHVKDRMVAAHIISWVLSKGDIADGMKVLHKCDVTECVNPQHLFLGTQLDNVRDMIKKGRKKSAKGERQGSAKLTEKQVKEIRKTYIRGGGRYNRGNSALLAEKFGIAQATIYDVMNKGWRHVK